MAQTVPGGDFTHLTLTNSPQAQIRKLLNEMHAITPPNQRFDKLSQQIETLASACMSPPENQFEASGKFAPMELRALNCLAANLGKTVSQPKLMEACYFDRAGDEPAIKVMDVRICAIRQKLKGMGYRIETIHSAGFRLVKCPDS